MPDPVDLLESFPRSLRVPSGDPTETRRDGDRRRRLERAGYAAAAVALVAAITIPLSVLGPNADHGQLPAKTPSVTTSVTQPAPSPAITGDGLSGTVPVVFPLLSGLPGTSPVHGPGIQGPSHSPINQQPMAACGGAQSDQSAPVDALYAGWADPETAYERQLRTFASSDQALAWATGLGSSWQQCPEADGSTRNDVYVDSEGGYFASMVTRYEEEGQPVPGVMVRQVTVVGQAVLVSLYAAAETAEPAPSRAGVLGDIAREQFDRAAVVRDAMGHRWLAFGDEAGVSIEQPAQAASALPGAPEDFVDFVAGLTTQAQQDWEGCPDADNGIRVQALADDEWAVGGVESCGGYVAIWHRTSDGWREVLGTQDTPACADLDTLGVPRWLVGACPG